MAYVKNTWKDKDVITQEKLNNIENGIANVEDEISNIQLTPGPKGDTGEKGETGLQGEKGDKGDTGATGIGIKTITAALGGTDNKELTFTFTLTDESTQTASVTLP